MAKQRELEALMRVVDAQRQELEDLRKRVDSGVSVHAKTVEKSVKKSTSIMRRLRTFAWKHRSKMAMYAAAGAIASRPGANDGQIILAFLVANAWLIGYVQERIASTMGFFVTYHLFSPFILAYRSLDFLVKGVTGGSGKK